MIPRFLRQREADFAKRLLIEARQRSGDDPDTVERAPSSPAWGSWRVRSRRPSRPGHRLAQIKLGEKRRRNPRGDA